MWPCFRGSAHSELGVTEVLRGIQYTRNVNEEVFIHNVLQDSRTQESQGNLGDLLVPAGILRAFQYTQGRVLIAEAKQNPRHNEGVIYGQVHDKKQASRLPDKAGWRGFRMQVLFSV